jgi:LysM domain
MASLTAHLVETGDHGRLGFHPSCPVCRRERLFGPLSSEPVVSRRAQAVLAGSVLAFSTSAPAAAFAREPDRRGEGVQVPEDPGAGELDDPGFDPGGETALPFETAPVAPTSPDGGEHDDGAGEPLEGEPEDDPDARLVPPSEPDTLTPENPVATEDSAPVPPAEVVVTDEAPALPEAQVEEVAPAPPIDELSTDEPPARPPDRSEAKQRSPRPDPVSVKGPVGGPQERSAPVPAAAAEPVPVVVTQADLPETDRPEASLRRALSYVVAPGDSLWSIAKRLLEPDASPAQIAREVNRLWSLNEDRIGTGDPDLLMVGTQLSLR